MTDFDLDKMLYTIPAGLHGREEVLGALKQHPEVKFVSLTSIDLGGHAIDDKIPICKLLNDFDEIMQEGVQTDGSSVALPLIAELSNARVDILPDPDVNWYVEYNFLNRDYKTGLPVGTLRIPSFLRHNNDTMVGARIFLKNSCERFKSDIIQVLRDNPYVFKHIGEVESADEIESISLTSATELEFWVKTPDDQADRAELSTSQELKEQYWKRTIGPVGTALEQALELLDKYGFGIEMGHKEVGGVRAKLGHTGTYDHIMEQLEIDWKYSNPMQAADNEVQVKHIVRDVFRLQGLEVTFLAKPINGVAGSGEHTHLGMTANLKDGRVVNLFEPADRERDFMSPVGFGALMGILRNYEILNPFVSASNDSFNRMKPGYEAPVCTVTSLGQDCSTPSRNRTVLIGLVRNLEHPLATRFELRSPNPHSNTYMLVGAGYSVMMDGIKSALEAGKTPQELEKSISKKSGEEDFYLLKNREYRSEENVFDYYTQVERERLFGKVPATVWENFKAFEDYADRMPILDGGDEVMKLIIQSYRAQMLSKWSTEVYERIIPNTMNAIRQYSKIHDESSVSAYDIINWKEVNEIRKELGKDETGSKCLLTRAKEALDRGYFDKASDLEVQILGKVEDLRDAYRRYAKNLF